ncbi:MAG: discoidin domain-containing protein [Muribaculaceae bacterium]|nr:discoidin domain-containing protein [Muribaculaceae bacterium]
MKKFAAIIIASTMAIATANADDRPTVYMVSNAHLDTQWNWDIQTTISQYVWNTINQNLFLLQNYPNYIFNFEGGVKYSFMKEYYPREYELVKEYIQNGRWHISGASWEASDAIVPSTESFIRNILQGQQYYRDEFGVESTDIFLPDCFGFGWTLPTIANHCGLIGFSSQKLEWRQRPMHSEGRRYPYSVGLWKGVDGATIMMTHGHDYGRRWQNEDLTYNDAVKASVEESGIGRSMRYYGTGDIGGSPTQTSVLAVEKSVNGDGPVKVVSATSDQIFKYYQPYDSHPELPIYDGELLMDVHGTGCYTSQAAMKRYNRQNEQLGDAAERASVVAEYATGEGYPSESITRSWRRFLWHQFHDDLTGTSIPRAYEFSWNDELISLKEFEGVMSNSVEAVAANMDTRVKGVPVVIYNPVGFEAADIVEINVPAKHRPASASVYDSKGQKLRSQVVDYADGKARILVETSVPSIGFEVIDVRLSGKGKAPKATQADAIENSLYSIRFDANGDIASLYDKTIGRELVANGKAIRLALFTQNRSHEWPAWEVLKETTDREPISIAGDVKVSLVERGPLRSTILVEKTHGESQFRQYISLYEGELAERIDFYNEIDWAQTDALLKAEFPLSVSNPKATYDLGIGVAQRGNNTPTAYEVYAQHWADLTDSGNTYGVTILNDCKYGWDKPNDNTLRLTLLHTPSTPNRYIYQNQQDLGFHTFTYSIKPHAGSLSRADAAKSGERLNQRVKAYTTDRHSGKLGREYSFASTDADNVVIKAMKKAEKGDDYVVRVYETAGTGASASIILPNEIVSAYCADGTEKALKPANIDGNRIKVDLTANGIATFRVKLAGAAEPATLSAHSIDLPFNKGCFSANQFRHDANFSAGYSYATELLPETLIVDNIPFRIEKREPLNGMQCKADTISLPEGTKRLCLLAATATEDNDAKGTIQVGNATTDIVVPSYTGFIGQWGHTGHTEGYLKQSRIAYCGTHRHSAEGDQPYEFTYMFLYEIDVPEGVNKVVMPNNQDIVVFAATALDHRRHDVAAASTMFHTNIRTASVAEAKNAKVDLLDDAQIISYSGYVKEKEAPSMLIDGNLTTKWCDVTMLPNNIDFDLNGVKTISEWEITNAAIESHNYVTTSCYLMGKVNADDEWKTIDYITGNKRNVVNRKLSTPVEVRYLRLLVTQPEQSAQSGVTRIYELSVY